jgi:hypothetical protein
MRALRETTGRTGYRLAATPKWKAILDAHDGVLHAKFQSFECRAGGPAVKMLEEAVR